MRDLLKQGFFYLSFTQCLLALSPLKEAEDRRDINAPALNEAIHSNIASERALAARALGRIQKAEGVDSLLKLSQDKDATVQREAIFALGQLGWEETFSNGRELEIAKALSSHLDSPSAELKRVVVQAIGKLGLDETPQVLATYLNDFHPSVRAETIIALYRYRLVQRLRNPTANPALLSEEQMNRMLSLQNDLNKEVKRNLAYYFWRVKDARGTQVLIDLSASRDLWTRYFAISALAKYESEKIPEILLDATSDDSYHVRSAALISLTAKGLAKDLSPALRGDPSYHVRMTYVQALATLAPAADAKVKLLELYSDPKDSVKAEALKALSAFANSFETIRNASESKSWLLRSAAAASTTSLSKEEQKQILEIALEDEDTRVRVTALEALAGVEDSYAYTAIERGLKSVELSERGTAISALASRKEETRMRVAFDCYQNSQEEKWVEAREEIVKLWGSLVSEETTSFLKTASQDSSKGVALLAVKALEERGINGTIANAVETLSFSPYRELIFKRNPKITFLTTKGEIKLELFYKEAPLHVANIVGFAEESKYNGLPFHRVVSNFVVQGGDPDKSGWGSAGYSMRAEVNGRSFLRGTLGMPRSTGFDTGGIQLFINHIPTPHLDGQYTVFGQVFEGMDVVDQIEVVDLIISTQVNR